ncbi:unnamed protein product [Lepidochelys olivacea]
MSACRLAGEGLTTIELAAAAVQSGAGAGEGETERGARAPSCAQPSVCTGFSVVSSCGCDHSRAWRKGQHRRETRKQGRKKGIPEAAWEEPKGTVLVAKPGCTQYSCQQVKEVWAG